jgi:hypothetical protein
LTGRGQALEPAIVALGSFGGRFLPERPDTKVFRARWTVGGLKKRLARPQLPGWSRSRSWSSLSDIRMGEARERSNAEKQSAQIEVDRQEM